MRNTLTFIAEFIGLLMITAIFWVYLILGSVWENEVRCENGATEYCQGGNDGKIHE